MRYDGLEVLTDGVFDYAGMYPPASLSLNKALEHAAAASHDLSRPHLKGADMVVDSSALAKLIATPLERIGFPEGSTVHVCLLGLPPDGALKEGKPLGAMDLALIDDCHAHSANEPVKIKVTSLEMKARAELLSQLEQGFSELAGELETRGVSAVIEPDLSHDNWHASLTGTFKVLERASSMCGPRNLWLKVRCTGSAGSAGAGIDADRLTVVIASLSSLPFSFKATAGLHHPIREPARYGNSLGFLNLLAAYYLRRHYRHDFDEETIFSCLTNEAPDAFNFSAGLSYRSFHVPLGVLRVLKRNFPMSIGSCSLAEPDADLARLFP